MESVGSAVVDFGRFCTGFLVVMGVGMYSLSTNIVEDGRNLGRWNACYEAFVLIFGCLQLFRRCWPTAA